MEERLKYANERLLINDISNEERDRNLIFVYCPPKVGSTSLVTSLRLFAYEKFHILHLHSEEILKALYEIDVSINDIIKYNSSLGKNIFVIDIYRFPIEQKISIFFEKLEKFHFNNVVENIEKFSIEKLINRFNDLFPHLGNKDYFRNEYCITYPEVFDFEKKYCSVKIDNIHYIKLRLSDSATYWSDVLREVLNINVKIVRDYETSEKSIKHIFKQFMENYKIPENLLDAVKSDTMLSFYNNKKEIDDYIDVWNQNSSSARIPYTKEEYILYNTISCENQYMSEIQSNHYLDNGCSCKKCMEQRIRLREKLSAGENVDIRIKHENVQKIQPKMFVTRVIVKKKPKVVVGLNMLKGNR